MPPAIIPEKAIILHTLEDAGIYIHLIMILRGKCRRYTIVTI